MVELILFDVRLDPPVQQPVVLLRERAGERLLPIWIGSSEANAIEFARQGVDPPRPMTHDLLKGLLDELGTRVDRIVIDDLRDGTFYATIHLQGPSRTHTISSRPSDAIALAIRAGAPIFAVDQVLNEAAVVMQDDDEDQEVERFREFLEKISPDDFE